MVSIQTQDTQTHYSDNKIHISTFLMKQNLFFFLLISSVCTQFNLARTDSCPGTHNDTLTITTSAFDTNSRLDMEAAVQPLPVTLRSREIQGSYLSQRLLFVTAISRVFPQSLQASDGARTRPVPLHIPYLYLFAAHAIVCRHINCAVRSIFQRNRTEQTCVSEGTLWSSALYVICVGSRVLKFVFGFLYHAFIQSLHAKAGMMHEGRLNNMKILFHLQLDVQNSCLVTYNTFIKILYMFRALPCSSSGYSYDVDLLKMSRVMLETCRGF